MSVKKSMFVSTKETRPGFNFRHVKYSLVLPKFPLVGLPLKPGLSCYTDLRVYLLVTYNMVFLQMFWQSLYHAGVLWPIQSHLALHCDTYRGTHWLASGHDEGWHALCPDDDILEELVLPGGILSR